MNDKISILITGDTHLGGGRVKELAIQNNVENLFGDLLEPIQNGDLVITNLESPLIDEGIPINKTGPNLKSPTQSIRVLKKAGFNLFTLANNHIMDYGERGLSTTLEICNQFGINTVGAGRNLPEANKTFYFMQYGLQVAIINIAENEFGTSNGNGFGAHPLNVVANYNTIQEAKKKADKVIIIIHGGHEYYQLPSPRMKATYRYFVDVGADAVIAHHPHCYSGYEVYKSAPIFYSLGNFLFDKNGKEKSDDWNIGFMVNLIIEKESNLSFKKIPYSQNGKQVGIRKLDNEENIQFQKGIEKLNNIISDDAKVEQNFDDYCKKSRKLYSSYIEPYSSNFLHALRNRNLFPSLLRKRKKNLLLNLTRCESHRDVLIKLLDYENSYSSKGK